MSEYEYEKVEGMTVGQVVDAMDSGSDFYYPKNQGMEMLNRNLHDIEYVIKNNQIHTRKEKIVMGSSRVYSRSIFFKQIRHITSAESKFVELLELEYAREGSVKPISEELVSRSSSLRQRIQRAREAENTKNKILNMVGKSCG